MKGKRLLSMVLAVAMLLSFWTIPGLAFDTGYESAIDIGTSFNRTTDKISSSDASVWYKFTISQTPMAYGFTLRDMPSGSPFSYELYYQDVSGAQPKMLNMTPRLSPSGYRVMDGVLDKTGTYYIRVYSLTGAYSSTAYRFTGSAGRNGYSAYIATSVKATSDNLDWAACAEMAGKYKYYRDVTTSLAPNRTANMAAKYIQSGKISDSGTPTNAKAGSTKATALKEVANAANYILSGTQMLNPAFVVKSSNVPSMTDCLKVIWEDQDVMIMRMANWEADVESASRYLLLSGVNVASNTLTFRDPKLSSSSYTVDYDDFTTRGYEGDGYATHYNGDSIVCAY